MVDYHSRSKKKDRRLRKLTPILFASPAEGDSMRGSSILCKDLHLRATRRVLTSPAQSDEHRALECWHAGGMLMCIRSGFRFVKMTSALCNRRHGTVAKEIGHTLHVLYNGSPMTETVLISQSLNAFVNRQSRCSVSITST